MVLACALVTGTGDAWARTVQVCTGPDNLFPPPSGCFDIDTTTIGGRAFQDYVVTRPGSLHFDLAAERKGLSRLTPDTAALYCAVNPAARTRAGLPALTFASSRLVIHTQQWNDGQLRTADVARLGFTDLRTSDGLVVPSLEVALHLQRGANADPRLNLLFTGASGVPEMAGLDGTWFNVDPATREFSHPRFATIGERARRLAFALLDRAPTLMAAMSPSTYPGPADPPWTLSTVVAQSTLFRDASFAVPQPRFDPIVTLNCSLFGGYQTCTEEPALRAFAAYLQKYGADYLESRDSAMLAGLLANLRAWAAADALSIIPGIVKGQPNQPDFVPKYLLQQFVMPVITTWSLLRNDPQVGAADRALIEGWVDRVVAFAGEPFGGPGADDMPWNPGYLTVGVRMAWGVVKGNDEAVARGVERVYMGLHQMRKDGSFPREVARGACALGYQTWQTHHLVVLAELAARQGYDAYALSVDGKTLHDAIKFILDVMDDPTLIAAYATQNPSSCNAPAGSPLQIPTIVGDNDGDSPFAWMEWYIARFPSHPNASRLAKLKPGGLTANRPVHHIMSGANTTCFAADRTALPITPPGTAVEYFHAGFDHYFVTALAPEIDAVDAGMVSGWNRTGAAFRVFPLGSNGASSVCRFFSASFAPKSSHFYTPIANECAQVRTNLDWQFEGNVFAVRLPDPAGNCSADTAPLYRLYNNGRSGAPNHRYTTQATTRSAMIAEGYVPEGFGALGVIGCVPR